MLRSVINQRGRCINTPLTGKRDMCSKSSHTDSRFALSPPYHCLIVRKTLVNERKVLRSSSSSVPYSLFCLVSSGLRRPLDSFSLYPLSSLVHDQSFFFLLVLFTPPVTVKRCSALQFSLFDMTVTVDARTANILYPALLVVLPGTESS